VGEATNAAADVDGVVHILDIDDLILTEQFGSRAKDLEDIRLLRILKANRRAMNERLRDEIERPLSTEERRNYLEHPVSDFERAEVLALVKWFLRRYPTPAERLAYARRAYARWARSRAAPEGHD
jgi:hypothetical protein